MAEPIPVEDLLKVKTYVINSVAEYQLLIHCTDAPAIDFAHYTLLIGKMKTPNIDYLRS